MFTAKILNNEGV